MKNIAIRLIIRALGIICRRRTSGLFKLKPNRKEACGYLSHVCVTLLIAWAGILQAAELYKPKADAELLTIEGIVEYSKVGTPAWQAARTNMALMFGDRLRTKIRSRATYKLSNETVVRMDELTTATLRPTNATPHKPGLEVEGGAVYFFNRERPTSLEIKTPLSSGAIRGTEFHVSVGPNGKTVLTVIEGEVDLTNELGAVNLKTGDEGIVEPGQKPRKTPMLEAINIIQWALYYPGVLDLSELALTEAEATALAVSLAAYRQGDLLQAASAYPENRQPASEGERTYHAAVMLAVGRVDQTEKDLQGLNSPLADALRQLIATVKQQDWQRTAQPTLATEWLAESYYLQSRGFLTRALEAAKAAATKSPQFGFAQVRVAELEFSFGRTPAAKQALATGLQLSPRNAQAAALQGFLLAAESRIHEAERQFDQAIALDGALGNAWLGRGLCRIKLGHGEDGRLDLQVAATLEPNRSILRSYLGKAWSYTSRKVLADKELSLARRLDKNDPTPWFYSALLDQQQNRINDAVRNLEKSTELNENRKIYRSKLLLDQDRSVQGANLAAIYQDAGMKEVAVSEASKAVISDYANHSAHLFLANAYDALRDPKSLNLRYEAPWLSELLLANLFAPPGAGSLSRYVSQQEYSRLFDRDRFGISSSTDYDSGGNWFQRGSQYGNFGNFSYAFDYEYRLDNGQRLNADLASTYYSLKLKQQVTPADTLLFQADMADQKAGDLTQYYSNITPRPRQQVHDEIEPAIYAGFNHRWAPGVHTLVLAAFVQNNFTLNDADNTVLSFPRTAAGVPTGPALNLKFPMRFNSELTAYSAEIQQLFQVRKHTLVLGARYQYGELDNLAAYSKGFGGFIGPLFPASRTDAIGVHLDRLSGYIYDSWQILDTLQISGGLTLDRLSYPINSEVAPLNSGMTHQSQVSPKAGILWTPFKNTALRGAYTRSLGGVFFDNSIRLEPVQVAGINQAFRSLIPESVSGLIAGTEFETFAVAFDQKFKTGTYLTLGGDWLTSEADRNLGTYDRFAGSLTARPMTERQHFNYEEKSLLIAVNQLVGEHVSLGVSYRLSDARLNQNLANIPTALSPPQLNEATLHTFRPYVMFNHRCGFFSQFEAAWYQQSNRGYAPDIPGDDFWQLNAYIGYRFPRRKAELRLGLLNLTDQNYSLNPLNLYQELPRERTFAASLRFNF